MLTQLLKVHYIIIVYDKKLNIIKQNIDYHEVGMI